MSSPEKCGLLSVSELAGSGFGLWNLGGLIRNMGERSSLVLTPLRQLFVRRWQEALVPSTTEPETDIEQTRLHEADVQLNLAQKFDSYQPERALVLIGGDPFSPDLRVAAAIWFVMLQPEGGLIDIPRQIRSYAGWERMVSAPLTWKERHTVFTHAVCGSVVAVNKDEMNIGARSPLRAIIESVRKAYPQVRMVPMSRFGQWNIEEMRGWSDSPAYQMLVATMPAAVHFYCAPDRGPVGMHQKMGALPWCIWGNVFPDHDSHRIWNNMFDSRPDDPLSGYVNVGACYPLVSAPEEEVAIKAVIEQRQALAQRIKAGKVTPDDLRRMFIRSGNAAVCRDIPMEMLQGYMMANMTL